MVIVVGRAELDLFTNSKANDTVHAIDHLEGGGSLDEEREEHATQVKKKGRIGATSPPIERKASVHPKRVLLAGGYETRECHTREHAWHCGHTRRYT